MAPNVSLRPLALLVLCVLASSSSKKFEKVNLLMPHVKPTTPDTYLCISMKMNTTADYIVGFSPHANMNTAHHILLYGCGEPGSKDKVWNCGEMANKDTSKYKGGSTCNSSPSIIYAWAMDAPSLKLPEDVGFKVGGSTSVKYLVMQIHYKNVKKFIPPLDGNDNSGITLTVSRNPMRRRAGVYLLGTAGVIPRRSTVYMESACLYNERYVLHPFSYRTHTHVHGKVVSGYLIHNGKWEELGRKNPQLPQMFYNLTTPGLVVKRGDILAARCTMKNNEPRDIYIGATQNDEMCNFYIMYYVNGDRIPDDNYCFTSGPLRWSWRNFGFQRRFQLSNSPRTISVEPDSKTYYRQSILQNERPRTENRMVADQQPDMKEVKNLLNLLRHRELLKQQQEEEEEEEEEVPENSLGYDNLNVY